MDIDFGVRTPDWEKYQELKDRLVDTGLFRPDPRNSQRLIFCEAGSAQGTAVDLVPFGGVASSDATIAWPPDGESVMNVAGFDDTLRGAISLEMPSGPSIVVASLPCLAALKIFAWNDRRHETKRDVTDLWTLLTQYFEAGNEDRIYGDELSLLETVDYDLELAGAALLGRDTRAAMRADTRTLLEAIIRQPSNHHALLEDLQNETYAENSDRVEQMFRLFLDELLGNAQ